MWSFQHLVSISVWLMDSESDSYGNVYAKNPITGNSGPVCHHGFSQLDVMYIICSLNIGKRS